MEYITILIMKQKTRFKNFGNIGYRSMNAGAHPGGLLGCHERPLCTAGTQHQSRW